MFGNPKKPTRVELAEMMERKWKIEHGELPSPQREEEFDLPPLPKRKLTKAEKKIEDEKEKLKKAVVKQLRKTPLVQYACERTGVGRSTYYKWRAEDFVFARAAERAIEAGRFFVNDLAESKLLGQIKNDALPAITFWLRHNHPKYAYNNHTINEHEVATVRPSLEEDKIFSEEMSRIVSEQMVQPIGVELVKRYKERQLKEAERNQEADERFASFDED